jgi:hypothetical protein
MSDRGLPEALPGGSIVGRAFGNSLVPEVAT